MLRRPAVLLASSTALLVASFGLLATGRGGSREWVRGEAADEITASAVSDSARSVAFSRAAYPDGSAEAAVLARDDVWADALASTTLQGELGAPLLLTPPRSVRPEVLAELKRVGARTVYLVGGPQAFAPRVRQRLSAAGLRINVVEGGDAIANAVTVAERFLPDAKAAVLVRGAPSRDSDATRGYVDVLAAGAWAASARMPVLLTTPTVSRTRRPRTWPTRRSRRSSWPAAVSLWTARSPPSWSAWVCRSSASAATTALRPPPSSPSCAPRTPPAGGSC